ncbi:MAG: hypothetical protein JWQ42_2265 [Edaphobacter sp.]|nr:hypothetical protein [Edaphobacter sp.]
MQCLAKTKIEPHEFTIACRSKQAICSAAAASQEPSSSAFLKIWRLRRQPEITTGSLKIPSHRVSWQSASKCRRPHATIGSTVFAPNWSISSNPTDLVSQHLHLMHLVVVLDIEASQNRKPFGAK